MFVYLLEFEGLGVPIFGVCVALAVVGAVELFKWTSRNVISSREAEGLAVWSILTGLVGAKLWYEIFYNPEPFRDIFSPSGIVFYGGFLAGSVCFFMISLVKGYDIKALADCASLSVLFGYGVGRLGCQLSGDGDYGIPTSSFVGIPYPGGVVPVHTPVYPTPFFESAIVLIGLVMILRTFDSSRVGTLAYFYKVLLLMGLERFSIEFIRLNPRVLLGFTEAQIISLLLAIIGLFGIFKRLK